MSAIQIAFSNNKGGVGKTSIGRNIAEELAKTHKKRVLIVDLDAQCNLSRSVLDEQFDSIKYTSGEIFDKRSNISVNELIMPVPGNKNLSIIPGKADDIFFLEREVEESKKLLLEAEVLLKEESESGTLDKDKVKEFLVKTEEHKIDNSNWTKILKKKMSEVIDQFDYIFYDLPPSLTRIPINAWVSSQYLMIPISDPFALEGTAGLLKKMTGIKKDYNEDLKFIFFFNKVPTGKNKVGEFISRDFQYLMETLRDNIEENQTLKNTSFIMKSYIRYSKKFDTANGLAQSMSSLFSKESVVKDIKSLAKELITIAK